MAIAGLRGRGLQGRRGVRQNRQRPRIRRDALNLPRVDWLGLFPTLETVVSQIVVALIAVGGFGLNLFSAQKSRPVATKPR
ncbi:hypothetical protein CBM2585_A130016 [Cupriavidus taiwanensis]|nr:hypothetical protein CBM2585_A130016 [Cupriavidus taiwanensis]